MSIEFNDRSRRVEKERVDLAPWKVQQRRRCLRDRQDSLAAKFRRRLPEDADTPLIARLRPLKAAPGRHWVGR